MSRRTGVALGRLRRPVSGCRDGLGPGSSALWLESPSFGPGYRPQLNPYLNLAPNLVTGTGTATFNPGLNYFLRTIPELDQPRQQSSLRVLHPRSGTAGTGPDSARDCGRGPLHADGRHRPFDRVPVHRRILPHKRRTGDRPHDLSTTARRQVAAQALPGPSELHIQSTDEDRRMADASESDSEDTREREAPTPTPRHATTAPIVPRRRGRPSRRWSNSWASARVRPLPIPISAGSDGARGFGRRNRGLRGPGRTGPAAAWASSSRRGNGGPTGSSPSR